MRKIDRLWIGAVVGLIAPALLLIVLFRMGNFMDDFQDVDALFINVKYTIVLLKPSLLINLAIFLLFVNRNCLKFSRGIVMSTMLYVLFIVYTYLTN